MDRAKLLVLRTSGSKCRKCKTPMKILEKGGDKKTDKLICPNCFHEIGGQKRTRKRTF